MATSRRFEIAEFFPQPKVVELGEGISDLSLDVRLATSNVSPIQRKALRSILTLAGVRVVANKKKYVVDARVEDMDESPNAFDLSDVPAEVRHDYYELRVKGSEVFIRTPYQEGIVWAAQTLATLFSMMIDGRAVPNLFIRDWPILPQRGIMTDCSWSTDRMTFADWCQAIDSFSSLKLNILGVGIYDCLPELRISQKANGTEFMMTPLSEEPNASDPSSTTRYRYYNVKYDRWYDKNLPPAMFEDDFFADVLNYGYERGVKIFPCFNLLSRGTLLPRLIPALSARDSKGKPTGDGICLSSADSRKAIARILGTFLDKYYPEGCDYLHLGGADLGGCRQRPGKSAAESTWCQCKKCADADHGKLLSDFLEFLVPFLAEKGVGKVVLFSDQMVSGEKFLSGALGKMLKSKPEIASHLVIQWEDLGNEGTSKLITPAAGEKLGVESWITPLGCQDNFANFVDRRENIDAALKMALKRQAPIVARSQYDPAYQNHYALIGLRAWEPTNWTEDTVAAIQERWAELQWNAYADKLITAREKLSEAAANKVYQLIVPAEYFKQDTTVKRKGGDVLPPYPETALNLLLKCKTYQKELDKTADAAGEAFAIVSNMLSRVKWNSSQALALQSLFASSKRILINISLFKTLAELKNDIAKNGVSAKHADIVAKALEELQPELKLMEDNTPDWLVWITMQQLGCHKLYLEQLMDEIKSGVPAAKLRWALPDDWEAPEDEC